MQSKATQRNATPCRQSEAGRTKTEDIRTPRNLAVRLVLAVLYERKRKMDVYSTDTHLLHTFVLRS